MAVASYTSTRRPPPDPPGRWGGGRWRDAIFGDGDKIYALKWYLGLDEFYRWTPAETPPVNLQLSQTPGRGRRPPPGPRPHPGRDARAAGVFPLRGVRGAPPFHPTQVANMVRRRNPCSYPPLPASPPPDLPDGKPIITGVQESYQMHDNVNLNCTSFHSQPAAELTFYINGGQADPSWLVRYTPHEDPTTGLETSMLGLKFPLWPRLFRRGSTVTVKCTASILNMYFDSSEAVIQSDMPYHASIMEGRAAAATDSIYTRSKVLSVVASSLLLAILH
ncbi:uncharacterized protein LOC119576626 [Penaeus monodon]|uniref:uncharacterized protein LOC119576626 n=1 Tax=Penaeus monodon TaxID=6687 RepID=UPI0018A7121D|nr:uncharacterized protein LOC119576626 [Penaeus monodon]